MYLVFGLKHFFDTFIRKLLLSYCLNDEMCKFHVTGLSFCLLKVFGNLPLKTTFQFEQYFCIFNGIRLWLLGKKYA